MEKKTIYEGNQLPFRTGSRSFYSLLHLIHTSRVLTTNLPAGSSNNTRSTHCLSLLMLRHVRPDALVQGHPTIHGPLTARTRSSYALCHGNLSTPDYPSTEHAAYTSRFHSSHIHFTPIHLVQFFCIACTFLLLSARSSISMSLLVGSFLLCWRKPVGRQM